MKSLALLTLPLYVLDQLTKWLVYTRFELHSAHPVIPGFFDLVYVTNTGAAFGSFKGSNLFFIVLSAVVGVVLLVLHLRGLFKEAGAHVAVPLLLSGILGNLTDRLVHGHVIDFLSFDLHVPFASPWPAFNVADSCICVAAGIFLIAAFFSPKRETPPADNPTP